MTVYTSRFSIQWNYQPHDTGWGDAFNYLHRAVSALLHLYIISDAVDVAPTSPSEDESYFVPSTATGTWSTQHNKLAVYQGGAWQYYTLVPGVRAYIANRGGFLWWTGSLWSVEAAGGSGGFVQTVAGHSPDLAGNVALVVADVTGAAPLSSPPFTGTPTAPTPAAHTNNLQLATTAYVDGAVSALGGVTSITAGTGITVGYSAGVYTISLTSTYASTSYVDTAIANLVNSAPGTMDTLGEIATLLASDESTAAALATTVGGKVAKAGDTMTGDLHLVAPAGSDNTDKAVSSAWVRTFVSGLSYGTGTVTSVGLTLPADLSVSGSPVTGSGTLAVTRANQNANLVLAGPSSGSPATPGYRSLVAADLPGTVALTTGFTMSSDLHLSAPAGSDNSDKAVPSSWVRTFVASLGLGTGDGSVTSVAMSVPGVLYNIGGTPITTSGTLALTLKTQVKNTVFAGPTTGADAAPTMRTLVAADLPVQPYVVSGFYPGVPGNSQLLLVHQCAMAVTLAANLGSTSSGATSKAGCTVNATGSTVISIDQCPAASDPTSGGSWTQIGTLTIGAGGHAATLATASGSAKLLAAGDFIRAVGPATADATAANIFITLAGDR